MGRTEIEYVTSQEASYVDFAGAYTLDTSAINGVQFIFTDSDDFTAGRITLYGISHL